MSFCFISTIRFKKERNNDAKIFFGNNWESLKKLPNPAHIRKKCEICTKLTIKTPQQRQWRHYDVFTVRPYFTPCSSDSIAKIISHLVYVSIVNFEHVVAGWVLYNLFFWNPHPSMNFKLNFQCIHTFS